jgi:ATP-dependent helicase/nuclease subunit B
VNLFTLAPHVPFLDAVAAEWLGRAGSDPLEVARGLILLPTRRAARAMADAFLRSSGGRALLLPRIVAIGALDEAPMALAGALNLPPAVEPMQQLAVLARMILAMGGADGAPRTADQAWRLAVELAALMDEAERAEIDLAERLPDAADPDFAEHWARTLTFLRIVTTAWPGWLAEQGLMNPAARQVALLNAQAESWQRQPPEGRVLMAGITGGIPAVARLARVVGRLPSGAVLLPGLDCALDREAWGAVEESHHQAGLRRLLESLGVEREAVREWPVVPTNRVPEGRIETLRCALLPGVALGEWHGSGMADNAGIERLDPADQQEEAAAIALVLRDALETPGARAALVTPDRELAQRVTAELLRYGIVADDSAGESLAETPPAVFLRLLARAIAEELAPVALLALLKHPLAAAGLSPAMCRSGARALELVALRGPRPPPGLTGLRQALDRAPAPGRAEHRVIASRWENNPPAEVAMLLEHVEQALAPALRFAAPVEIAPAEAFAALIEAAERLAATDTMTGAARLWAAEEGAALAELLAAVRGCLSVLPDQPRTALPGLLDAVLAGAVVRSRRALRGRAGNTGEHPRVFIWGLLEARLQSVEVMVLGGLVEGVWPAAADPGPWLSRPMRARVGLPSPEVAVGQAAHDFVLAACAAPRVVLSYPRRRDGAPAVPSRWLTRLEMFLAGRDVGLPLHPAVGWARVLDQPAIRAEPVKPPKPLPAVVRRPRRLSVTEIETWLRDPYAIYARHVLRLAALNPLDQETDAADYGTLVHAGLRRFLEENGTRWPPNAAGRLQEHLIGVMQRAGMREALRNWWEPRLARIADWVAVTEIERRAQHELQQVWPEVPGCWELPRPGGLFTLIGRADRIERRMDGTLVILDYKTGHAPSMREVDAGIAPQLPLEAAMAAAGAFGAERQGRVTELSYWRVTGGFVPGQKLSLFKDDPAELAACVEGAEAALGALIDAFDDPSRCYLSRPHPGRAPRFSDYAQLARVAEWAAAGEDV